MSKINAVALAETENTAVASSQRHRSVSRLMRIQSRRRHIIGSLMKFSKGDYIAGENRQSIPIGATVTANLDEFLAGWIQWQDGKPIEHVMVRIGDGVQPMKRAELGDEDPTNVGNRQQRPAERLVAVHKLPAADGCGRLRCTPSPHHRVVALVPLAISCVATAGIAASTRMSIRSLRSMSMPTSTTTRHSAASRCRSSRQWAGSRRASSTKRWLRWAVASVKLRRLLLILPTK